LRHLIGQADKTFRQLLKALIVLHLLGNRACLFSGNVLGELLAVPIALKHEIGAMGERATAPVPPEEMPAQGPATHPVDRVHLGQDQFSLFFQ